MTGNNPRLDLVNVNVYTKFGQILSIPPQDIERKLRSKCSQNYGTTESQDRVNPV